MQSRIVINETDLTTAEISVLSATQSGILVPGFYKYTDGDESDLKYTIIEKVGSTLSTDNKVTFTSPVTYVDTEESESSWEQSYFVKTKDFEKDTDELTESDLGFDYANTLLSMGFKVYYLVLNGKDENPEAFKFNDIYERLEGAFDLDGDAADYILDYNECDIKYITSGGYPSIGFGANGKDLANAMATVAATRSDCVAIIEHTDFAGRDIKHHSSGNDVMNLVSGFGPDAPKFSASFATMFTPYLERGNSTIIPSIAYFMAIAAHSSMDSAQAVAGVVNGGVPSITNTKTSRKFTERIANSYVYDFDGSDITNSITNSVNPICYINPYGYAIWGNRTLLGGNTSAFEATQFASRFLNIRCMLCDIKKEIRNLANPMFFQQNTDELWLNFSGQLHDFLDGYVSSGFIGGFSIVRTDGSKPYQISATIRIQPLYAVEQFEISVLLTDDMTQVQELYQD